LTGLWGRRGADLQKTRKEEKVTHLLKKGASKHKSSERRKTLLVRLDREATPKTALKNQREGGKAVSQGQKNAPAERYFGSNTGRKEKSEISSKNNKIKGKREEISGNSNVRKRAGGET